MVKKVKYFTCRETSDEGSFIIVPADYDNFPWNTKEGGSYAVAPARVLGLDYSDYLLFVLNRFRDIVTIRGKDSLYPVVYWKKSTELNLFIALLNNKLSLGMEGLQNGK